VRIVALDTFPVSVPYRHTERSSRVVRDGVTDVIVRLTADDGTVGWGESCSGADTRSVESAVRSMAPRVLGRSPWQLDAIAHEVFSDGLWGYRTQTACFAFAGIDMALWDLLGKVVGQPLHRLLGGACRAEVDYFYYLSGDPELLDDECREGVERGYSCFYLKVGVDHRAEEAKLQRIRTAIGPTRKIRIDANEAWTVAAASQLLRRWHEAFVLDFVEAPVRCAPPILMQQLRDLVPVRLCANEGLGGEREVLETIHSAAADVLCFSSYWVGSLRRFQWLSLYAHARDISVCKHTHGELGIAAAAAHHVMLTLPNTIDGCQQTAAIMDADVLMDELPIAHGPRWGEPAGPGLGIEVDEAKLRHFHEAYLRNGQFLPYAVSR
jgi:L-alanine-DL-glutamate epimerase-like enolase superfamily enzyme